ncbi:MAG: DUF748 domain-containing protein [Gammaproteobacteria bacterium]|nr:DUF748 domain-containing protein [Gammaproteobacteria bacterium]
MMALSELERAEYNPGILREKWLNYRRKRFWVVVFILLYTVFGFFLAPVLVNKLVVDTVREKLGREASLERVQINPYVLSLRATGFHLLDTDEVKLAGFEEFFVNFQLSSLFNRAWTFRTIRLDGANLHFERFAQDDSRLSRLLADMQANSESDEPSAGGDGDLPRLLIHDLNLSGGILDFRDHVPETTVAIKFGPIDVSVQELNTLPDRSGRQSVFIRLPDEAHLKWQGTLSLAPLDSSGELTIENSSLAQTIAYLEATLPLDSIKARMSVSTRYHINAREDGGIAVALDDLAVDLSDVAVSGLDPVSEFFTLAALEVSGGAFRFPDNTLKFTRIKLTEPGISASLDESGKFNLLDLKPESSSPAGSDSDRSADETPAWQVDVDAFLVEGGQAQFADNRIAPPGGLTLEGLQLMATNLGNEASRRMPIKLQGSLNGAGSFGFDGEVAALPDFSLTGQASTNAVQLQLAQPYVQQALNLQIESGSLNSQLDVEIGAEAAEISGTVSIEGLDITDTARDEQLVGWSRLDIDRFEANTAARKLRVSRAELEQPFGRVTIYPDRTTNLSGLQVPGESGKSAPVEPDAAPWSFVIGAVSLNDAAMDFSDLSLPLPFATHISSMDGAFSTMDSSSAEPAIIRLEGQVDEYGLARIEGAMNVFDPLSDTDVTVEFRNLLMSNLSPYSAQFAGQKIDEGKLNLDLEYVIKQGQMQGSNAVVLSDLVLGDKVDSPDAASLPLGLAVALLTDSNGVIDIDLPVEGNVNDPEFRIGGVIFKALAGLITKVVSAPFRMLGSLIGIESEDLGQFQFLAGRSDLTPPELEKIGQLQTALQQRPELSVEITGPYDTAIDTPKLKFFSLREQVVALMGGNAARPADEAAMLDEEIRSVFESLFRERFPEQSLQDLKAVHTRPPVEDPEGKAVLDELAYSADLRDRLLESEVITPQDLEQLASARAEAIRTAFVTDGNFSAERIIIAGAEETPSEDGEWVLTELGVAAD